MSKGEKARAQAQHELTLAAAHYVKVKGRFGPTSPMREQAFLRLDEAARFYATKSDEEWAGEVIEARELLKALWHSWPATPALKARITEYLKESYPND